MSASLNNFKCPHCLKDNATMFDSSWFIKPLDTDLICNVFTCKSCDHSVILEFDYQASNVIYDLYQKDKNFDIKISNHNSIMSSGFFIGQLLSVYPQEDPIGVPDHLSDVVSRNFKEAKELFIKGDFNQSGMTSRRAVDLATKELMPEHTGMLNSRIKILLDKGVITKELFKWADIIRLDGNSANHDYDDFTEQEAEQLLDFTEMFLMYGFTLPKMVEIKKQESITD